MDWHCEHAADLVLCSLTRVGSQRPSRRCGPSATASSASSRVRPLSQPQSWPIYTSLNLTAISLSKTGGRHPNLRALQSIPNELPVKYSDRLAGLVCLCLEPDPEKRASATELDAFMRNRSKTTAKEAKGKV